jgi:uncharacterized protein (DUF433 family)
MIAEKVDLSKYIEMRNDRPNIRGRRIEVVFIASAHHVNKWSVEELCDQFSLTEAQVLAALFYYYQNQAELDAQDEADMRESNALYERYKRDVK